MAVEISKLVFVCVIACVLRGCGGRDLGIVMDDDVEDSPLSATCMKCICKVMGCVKDEGCVGKVCGVMHLTQGYWEMAYNKTSSSSNTEAYQECSNNAWCATRTVQIYMKRFLPDCEAKRTDRLRCENAVALHTFGQKRCERNLTERFQQRLYTCLDENVWKWLGNEDE